MKRLIARFAKDCIGYFELVTVFDKEIQVEKIDKNNPIADTLMHKYPSAIWFERKIRDDFGIEFRGSFDDRALIHQESFPDGIHPMLKSFKVTKLHQAKWRSYPYETINGDGVFQVSVGPIHAGIIEPGHFHFSQAGEDMLHLEVRHFYKYRAIEKMLEGKSLSEAKPIIERISGNESVAYQIAWRDIFCQSTSRDLDDSLKLYGAFLLELERIIHHLTDIGFIPNDAGFGAALAYASRMSEDARRLMKRLTNSRFGFGGVNFEDNFTDKDELVKWLDKLRDDLGWFEEWIVDIPSVWDRFDTTGVLRTRDAIKYGAVGIVARASGLRRDVRLDDAFYGMHGFELQTGKSGDVAARFKLRIAEIYNSIDMMQSFLQSDDKRSIVEQDEVSIDGSYHSFVESSIGELFMYIDISGGKIKRFFVRDPSFVNWQALHLMMPGNIIADFPLINKSCDLSYAGNDL